MAFSMKSNETLISFDEGKSIKKNNLKASLQILQIISRHN